MTGPGVFGWLPRVGLLVGGDKGIYLDEMNQSNPAADKTAATRTVGGIAATKARPGQQRARCE